MRRALLLLVLAALLAPAAVDAQSSASGTLRVAVKEIDAGFGPESWKEEQPFLGDVGKSTALPALPVAYTGVYRNPYFDGRPRFLPAGPVNAWGYNATLTLELIDSRGAPLADPEPNLLVEASLRTSFGDVPAKLTKIAPAQFLARFDLDGEAGKRWPALLGGAATLVVDVFEQPPTAQPVKLASDAHTLAFTYAVPSLNGLPFPREALQVYSDLGNLTPHSLSTFSPSDAIPIAFSFGVPNAAAQVRVVNNRAAVTIFDGRTDATGTVSATVVPGDVLGDAAGGLLVVEAHLTGAGTGNRTLGNGLVVVPVQSHATLVRAIARETRAGATDPAATMRVTVQDPDAGPQAGGRHGFVVLLDGLTYVGRYPFLPVEPGSDVNHKFARYPAKDVVDAGLASYTLYSFLFTERNEFYSLAIADRGYSVSAPPVAVEEGASGVLRLTVRNLNDNRDGNPDYGLDAIVKLAVTGLPGGTNFTGEISVAEASSGVVEIPFLASGAGGYRVVLNSTADELRVDRTFSVDVTNPPSGLSGILGRLGVPGPGIGFVLLSAAAAVLLARRR